MEILEATKVRLLILLAACRQEEEALRELLSTKDFDLNAITGNLYAALGMITEVQCFIQINTFTKEEIEQRVNEVLPPTLLYIEYIEQLIMPRVVMLKSKFQILLNNIQTRETGTDESQSKTKN